MTQFHLFLQQWARCCCSGILWGEASCIAQAAAMGAWKLAEQRYLCPCQECKISSLPTSAGDNHPGTSRVRPRISVVWNLYDVFSPTAKICCKLKQSVNCTIAILIELSSLCQCLWLHNSILHCCVLHLKWWMLCSISSSTMYHSGVCTYFFFAKRTTKDTGNDNYDVLIVSIVQSYFVIRRGLILKIKQI